MERNIEDYDIRLLEKNERIIYSDDEGRRRGSEEVTGNDWLAVFLRNQHLQQDGSGNEERGDDKSSNATLDDDGVTDFDAINALYGYAPVSQCNDEHEDGDCNVNGIINNTEDRHVARILRGQRDYFDMKVSAVLNRK